MTVSICKDTPSGDKVNWAIPEKNPYLSQVRSLEIPEGGGGLKSGGSMDIFWNCTSAENIDKKP